MPFVHNKLLEQIRALIYTAIGLLISNKINAKVRKEFVSQLINILEYHLICGLIPLPN